MSKVSISATERNDLQMFGEHGVHPLFHHETSQVIGELRHGKITYYPGRSLQGNNSKTKSETPLVDSLESGTDYPSPQVPITRNKSRLDKVPSLTTLLGGA
jgi:hypothetical protein